MSEIRTRKRKKKTDFSGSSVSFSTKRGPLQLLKRIASFDWNPPAGISTLLLMFFVFIYSSNFVILLHPLDALESLTFTNAGGGVIDARTDGIQLLKANLGIGLDAFVAIYTLFFLKPIYRVVMANPHLAVIVGLLLFGMSFSANPEQVFFSTVQLGVGILIALIYAIQNSGTERWDRKFCYTILFPLFVVHLYSVVIFFSNGLALSDYGFGAARFGGLPGNPNVAAGSAVIGLWAVLYLLFGRVSGVFLKVYAGLCIAIFTFTVAMSGSGTSFTVSIALVALMIWLKFLSLFQSAVKRVAYVILGGVVMMLLVGSIMVNNSTEDLANSFTSSLGKRSDLAGRTELWDIAFEAIAERPLLGWSLDQHETVQTERKFVLPNGLMHFHNGFLDTAVAGGLLLLACILWNMSTYVRNCFKAWRTQRHMYGLIAPLVLLILLNMSEYSLLRPLSVLFQVYLCTYFLLLVSAMAEDEDSQPIKAVAKSRESTGERLDKKRSSRGGKRYKF